LSVERLPLGADTGISGEAFFTVSFDHNL
jgi:hypothetical protein